MLSFNPIDPFFPFFILLASLSSAVLCSLAGAAMMIGFHHFIPPEINIQPTAQLFIARRPAAKSTAKAHIKTMLITQLSHVRQNSLF